MTEKYYIPNPNRFSSGMYCQDHNQVFDVRCYVCFRELGKDPEHTYLITKKTFGGLEKREFSLIWDSDKNPN
jgi:hypothetical protein